MSSWTGSILFGTSITRLFDLAFGTSSGKLSLAYMITVADGLNRRTHCTGPLSPSLGRYSVHPDV